jgi:integrase
VGIHGKTFLSLLGDNPKITKKRGGVERVEATGKVHDGAGLNLIVGEKTQRSWMYVYRFGGENKSVNLGSAHKIDLIAARALREECEAWLAKNLDPKVQRDRRKAALAVATTSQDKRSLFEWAQLAAEDIGPKHRDELEQAKKRRYWANQVAPKLTAGVGALAPRDITREDIAAALKAIEARTTCSEQRRKVEGQLRALFEWCAAPIKGRPLPDDWINPVNFAGRARGLITPVEKREVSHAAIGWREIGGVVADLRAKPDIRALCIEWTLLSVARVGTALTADWTELDLDHQVWTIPAAKMKIKDVGGHRVPLTKRHMEILALVTPAGGAPKSGLLFPCPNKGTLTAEDLRDFLRRLYPHVITRSDGTQRQVSVHGLRSTFRTWAGMQTNPRTKLPLYDETTLELCMAHVVGDAARRAYIHETNVEVRRTVMDAWAAFVSRPEGVVRAFPRAVA